MTYNITMHAKVTDPSCQIRGNNFNNMIYATTMTFKPRRMTQIGAFSFLSVFRLNNGDKIHNLYYLHVSVVSIT